MKGTTCWLLSIAVATMAVSRTGADAPSQAPTVVTPALQTESISNALSPLARTRAELWALSPTEWQRYASLMTGIRGTISPANISPIEVLGIHARDLVERQKYAERWARLMHDDVERVLAFQHAYDEASRRLFPHEPLIAERAEASASPVGPDIAENDRVLLFVAPSCTACDTALATVLQRLDGIAGLDIYLSAVKTDDVSAVRTWAASHGIPPEQVKRGKVTLNFDAGTLKQLGHEGTTLPIAMRRRGEAISPLSVDTL